MPILIRPGQCLGVAIWPNKHDRISKNNKGSKPITGFKRKSTFKKRMDR